MQVRFARHTERLGEVVAFYRDRLGLPEIGRFADHDGYDGVFLALPGTGAHLEFTSGGGHDAPVAHPESLLVHTTDVSTGGVASPDGPWEPVRAMTDEFPARRCAVELRASKAPPEC